MPWASQGIGDRPDPPLGKSSPLALPTGGTEGRPKLPRSSVACC